jgi:hypothetical protein
MVRRGVEPGVRAINMRKSIPLAFMVIACALVLCARIGQADTKQAVSPVQVNNVAPASGHWETEVVDRSQSVGSMGPRGLAIDAAGYAHAAFSGASDNGVFYAWQDDAVRVRSLPCCWRQRGHPSRLPNKRGVDLCAAV